MDYGRQWSRVSPEKAPEERRTPKPYGPSLVTALATGFGPRLCLWRFGSRRPRTKETLLALAAICSLGSGWLYPPPFLVGSEEVRAEMKKTLNIRGVKIIQIVAKISPGLSRIGVQIPMKKRFYKCFQIRYLKRPFWSENGALIYD